MAIADAKKRKVGQQLVEWIYLGIRTGARRSVGEYRKRLATGDSTGAIAHLKRAVDLPHRARTRVETRIASYNAENGAGAAETYLQECLALFGAVTLSDLNTELTALESYAATLVAAAPAPYGDGSMTWEQIASDIEANVRDESPDWIFPLPEQYTDIWGE